MQLHRHTFEALGTYWSIETPAILTDGDKSAVADRIATYEQTYSRFLVDSLVSTIAQTAGTYTFPSDAELLFAVYDRLYTATDGAVSPLVGDRLAALGYDANYSWQPKLRLPAIAPWPQTVLRENNKLTVKKPVTIDVGAAGKGYLADLVALVLQTRGHTSYLIDASGDIVSHGMPPETIGLANPRVKDEAVGSVQLRMGSVCASSPAERTWGSGMHHIIDGRTGEVAGEVIATWVIAEDGLTADGLATALFFTEPTKLSEFDFGYAIMYADGHVQHDTQHGWNFFTT